MNSQFETLLENKLRLMRYFIAFVPTAMGANKFYNTLYFIIDILFEKRSVNLYKMFIKRR